MIISKIKQAIIEVKSAINENEIEYLKQKEKFDNKDYLEQIKFNKNIANPLINSNQDYQEALKHLNEAIKRVNKANKYE